MVTTKGKVANRCSPKVRARAVRLVFEHKGSYETQAGAIAAFAPRIGCSPQTLDGWAKQVEKCYFRIPQDGGDCPKEFFRVGLEEVVEAVNRLVPSASFFSDREAQEWHETISLRTVTLKNLVRPSGELQKCI